MNSLHRAMMAAVVFLSIGSMAFADGLIQRLPKDGSWVRYDVKGSQASESGEVAVKLTGTVILKSVGQEMIDSKPGRWIEVEFEMDAATARGLRSRRIEAYKLLLPEEDLVAGKDPLAHVSKLFKKDVRGFVTDVDLNQDAVSKLAFLRGWLIKPLEKTRQTKDVELQTPAGAYKCTQISGTRPGEMEGVTEEFDTWQTDEVPFGVAGYRFGFDRKKSRGTYELKFAKSGTDAKTSVVPEEKEKAK